MITSNGKKATTNNDPVTVLSIDAPVSGVLSLWTFDAASAAGTLSINGGNIEVDAGKTSLQFPVKSKAGHCVTPTT